MKSLKAHKQLSQKEITQKILEEENKANKLLNKIHKTCGRIEQRNNEHLNMTNKTYAQNDIDTNNIQT